MIYLDRDGDGKHHALDSYRLLARKHVLKAALRRTGSSSRYASYAFYASTTCLIIWRLGVSSPCPMLRRPANVTAVVNMRKEPSRACYATFIHSAVTAIKAHVTTLDLVKAGSSSRMEGRAGH